MRMDAADASRVSDAMDGVNSFEFSRDAKWVAFTAGKPEERQVWLARVDSDAPPVALTKHATPVAEWAWTDDSTRIFFTAPDRVDKDDEKRIEKKFDVKIMDPDRPPVHLWSVPVAENGERPEKNEKRWTSGSDYSVAQFTLSRDSSLLAFRGASTNRHANRTHQDDSEIYLLTPSSCDVRRITNNRVAEGMPRFSPDGKWLAFAAPDDFAYLRNEKIYVAPTAGGALPKLLSDREHSANQLSSGHDSHNR